VVGEHEDGEGYMWVGSVGAGDGRRRVARGSSGAAAWRWHAGGRPARQGRRGEVGKLQGANGNQFRGLTRVEVERKVRLDGEVEWRR
jgi:hypothetical protein